MPNAYAPGPDYPRSPGAGEYAPGREVFPVTASASNLTRYFRSLWINTAGTVTGIPVANSDETPISFAVTAGSPLPIAFRTITACPANTLGII